MPSGPTSAASVVVSPSTAIFDAQYGVRPASGRLPLTEATLMTSPVPRSIIWGRNARHIRYTPRTLTAKTSSQSAGCTSTSGATGPGDAGVVDEDRDRLVGEVGAERVDTGRVGRRRPSPCGPRRRLRTPRRRSAASVDSRSTDGDDAAPAAANARVIDRPRPLPPPVTSAVRPASGACRFSHSRRPGRSRAATTAGRGRRTSPPARRPSGRGPRTARPVRRARRARRGRRSRRGR